MTSSRTGALAAATLLVGGSGAWPQAHADEPIARVPLPPNAPSVAILRDGEVLHTRPDVASERRGAAALDARLPALDAARGPGCETEWVRVGDDAWVCMDEAHFAPDAPTRVPEPALAPGADVPYEYAFATFAGVRTYRRLEDIDEDEWAEELERGMGVAIDGSRAFEGRRWAHTAGGRWIAMADLNPARPSTRQGLAYAHGAALDSVAFTDRRVAAFATPEGAAAVRHERPQSTLEARTALHLLERAAPRGRDVVRTDAGWISARAVRFPEAAAPPDGVGPSERWVDIDLRRQILVAYEGTQPVFATLVSSGRSDHPTERGTFRVWAKLATRDMSNADSDAIDSVASVYSVERVPWVMFFHNDQALHGAYWHDRFGTVHSHGCVNLAPRDARWLFDWAPPALPPGWSAALPTERDPGLRVRVR